MDVRISDSVSNEDLNPIALAHCRAGGSIIDLPSVIGISEQRAEEYRDWLWARIQPRFPDRDYPILIPETSPTSCISFKRALNLRELGELTGDWHFETSFFGYPERVDAPLAGPGGWVDTVPALGSLGVRDMGRIMAVQRIKPYDGPGAGVGSQPPSRDR